MTMGTRRTGLVGEQGRLLHLAVGESRRGAEREQEKGGRSDAHVRGPGELPRPHRGSRDATALVQGVQIRPRQNAARAMPIRSTATRKGGIACHPALPGALTACPTS